MNIISSVSTSPISSNRISLHPAVNVAVFLGLFLTAVCCRVAYGLDMSAGFF